MQLLKFIPIKLILFLVLGILIGHYFDLGVQIPVVLTVLFISILAYFFIKKLPRNSILFGTTALLSTISIGILAVSLWNPKNNANHYTHQNLKIEHSWQIKIREVLKSSSFSDRYIAQVISMDEKPVSGKILVSFPLDNTTQKLQVDNTLITFEKFSEIHSPLNPHQFDYKKYLERIGIYKQLILHKKNHFVAKIETKTTLGIAAALRIKLSAKLQEANFNQEALGVIQALLLGQRNDISEATYNNYKNAGAVHILAVSGLHIGIILLLLQIILQPLELLPKGKTIKLIVIILLLWCFALLAGFSASVIRAVTMFSFVAYALFLNRPSNTFNILALSMFFILLVINPMLLFQAGFQMSYAAVFSIVWIYPLMQKLWFPKNFLLKKVWQLLSVSMAAQLGVLPISLFYFHQFPGLFFVSNLLVVPFLGLILGVGILVIILSLFDILPDFVASWYNTLIVLMNGVVEWVAQQEAFIFRNISFDTMQLVLSYLIIIVCILAFSKLTFKRVIFLLISIIGFQVWMLFCTTKTAHKESLLVAHQSKNTILFHQSANKLQIIAKNDANTTRIATDYQIGERIKNISSKKLDNSYSFKNKTIVIIDSLGVYIPQKFDYVLLTQSPKINLERMLDSIQPELVLVDGSNYTSYVKRWEKTCAKRKLPFHFTGEKGVFYFE